MCSILHGFSLGKDIVIFFQLKILLQNFIICAKHNSKIALQYFILFHPKLHLLTQTLMGRFLKMHSGPKFIYPNIGGELSGSDLNKYIVKSEFHLRSKTEFQNVR